MVFRGLARIDTVFGERGRFRSVDVFQFPAPIWNLVRIADRHPNFPGVRDRDRSFVVRRWPIVVYFVRSGFGGTLPNGCLLRRAFGLFVILREFLVYFFHSP